MDEDYTTSGFNQQLSRGDAPSLGGNLDNEASVSNNATAYDRTQVTGALGDTLKIGNITFDGANGRIIMNDGENDVLLIGTDV